MKTITLSASLISLMIAVMGEGAKPVNRVYPDTEILAATLILEAGGEYAKGSMESVYEVIHNRSLKRRISPAHVVLQKYQFSCWNGVMLGAGIAKAKKHPRWNEAMRIVLSSPTNYTHGADHYHADYIKAPYWAKSMKVTTQIGRHIFYK